MKKEYKFIIAIIKGIFNGMLCSLVINIWIIISFYTNFTTKILYLIGLPLGFSVFLLMKQSKMKYFGIAWIYSVLLYLVTELVLNKLGLINIFYHKVVGDEIRMTAGDGFGIMVIHVFNYLWIIVGTIIAFVFTIISQKKANKNK